MPIRIVNSLTRKKEEFLPLNGKSVKMYVCGVTVYDVCHVGHARSLYIFDVIRQYFKYRGYDIFFVRNITDIDDKIINRAHELNKSFEEVVALNIQSYVNDLESLGISRADREPRATENIAEMITHIKGLIDKGLAYEAGGDVYFNVRKFTSYGKLSGQSMDKMYEAVRIEPDEKKKDPLDFALWKSSKPSEPSWDSPWGAGRPGWHIECSVMSMKHLGSPTLDIHAGGRDLIFPHHENEIAQSEGLTARPFARYWIHHGLLTINGQKMAKSLGNFITIQDALKKYSVDQLKMFFLSSHYASPIDFSESKMDETHKALDRFQIFFQKVDRLVKNKQSAKGARPFIQDYKTHFEEAMDDDFNTPKALGVLFEFLNEMNKFIDQESASADYEATLTAASQMLKNLTGDIFGLFKDNGLKINVNDIENLLKEREEARLRRDFNRSDQIRDELKNRGILLEDTKEGQIWRRA